MADTPNRVPQSMSDSANWFSDAPGGELDPTNFDALFSEVAAQPQPAPQQQPPAQPAKEFLIETSTGTKYRDLEATVKGTEEKDRYIAQLQKALESAGYDPRTGRPQAIPEKAPQRAEERREDESYLQNPKAFLRDLREALSRNDEDAFVRTHARFSAEIAAAQLQPYLPVATDFARNQALGRVSSEISDFNKFQNSEDYTKTLAAFPVLKQAIENAERTPEFYQQLPELYKIAYSASQGRRLPELLKAAPAQQPAQQPVRQTLQPSTLAPSPETAPQAQTADDLLKTKEGRQALIRDFETRYGNVKLTD